MDLHFFSIPAVLALLLSGVSGVTLVEAREPAPGYLERIERRQEVKELREAKRKAQEHGTTLQSADRKEAKECRADRRRC